MRKTIRSLALVAAVAGNVAVSGAPASADGGGAFEGTASIACFGCGDSNGTAELCFTGVTFPPVEAHICDGGRGDAFQSSNVHATFRVHESPSECPVTGSANGTTSGAVTVAFDWTRVGATAVITTTGDINGAGVAAFKVTDPVGVPCGGPVTATVVGAVAGT